MSDLQHFGITVTNQKSAHKFYTHLLKLPYLATTVNRGKKFDRMYRLEGSVNRLQWFQLLDEGVELFYLPTHPPRHREVSDIRLPGYRYISFWVKGFDDYIERIERSGVSLRTADTHYGRCALLQDPDGLNVILFEKPEPAKGGRIDSLGEAGLTVTSFKGYEEFFSVLESAPEVNGEDDFIRDLFQINESLKTRRYGYIRLLHFPHRQMQETERFFPYWGAQYRGYFPDPGLKHVAYYVDDIHAFYHKARKAGIYFLFPPCSIAGGGEMTYFLDPEGNTIEVMQIPTIIRAGAYLVGSLRMQQMAIFDTVKRKLKKS